MALEEFEKEHMTEREKGISQMRSISNYGMGIFLLLQVSFLCFQLNTRLVF